MVCSRTGSMIACAAMLMALTMTPARAQVARSGGSSANAQLLQQLQQLAAERTSLRAENDALKKKNDELSKALDSLKTAQKSLDARSKASAAELEQAKSEHATSEEQVKQLRDRMAELIAKFRETAQTLRDSETDRASLKQSLAGRERELSVCIDRNLALYQINDEALTRLEKQTFWSRLARSEPFTQLKRIEMENLVDDYRARAQDQRVTPRSPAAAAPVPTAPVPATPASTGPPHGGR